MTIKNKLKKYQRMMKIKNKNWRNKEKKRKEKKLLKIERIIEKKLYDFII